MRKAPRCLGDFGLLAMDMDSTLITIECLDEIADMVGLKPQMVAMTAAAMKGECDFDDSLKQRVALLKGTSQDVLQRVLDERLTLSPGADTLLLAARQAGLKTLLLSGGLTFFTEALKASLGFDAAYGNTVEIVDGLLTGQLIGPILNARAKKEKLLAACHQWEIDTEATLVIGDGANDVAMMQCAGLSVAFRAKPMVAAQADIALHGRLDDLLTVVF